LLDLRYIYSGKIPIEHQNVSDVLDLLVAADELMLEELLTCVQKYLIEHQSQWLHDNFSQVIHTVFHLQACKMLQDHFIDNICRDAQLFFSSPEFTSVEEDILLALLKRDDLDMEEIDIWDYVLKWGQAQIPALSDDVSEWTSEDFESLGKTLQNCIASIRFFEISPPDFYDKIRPFKPILPHDLYEDLVRSHYKPKEFQRIRALPPRSARVDSVLISSQHAALFNCWIDGENHKQALYHKPRYRFKLLFRGTRDGFTPSNFRRKCNNAGATIVLVKLELTEEIIGGYNPIGWSNRADYATTENSFIFNLGFGDSIDDIRLSRVSKNMSQSAIFDLEIYGPNFGRGDLVIYENCKVCSCRKSTTYEHEIIEPGDFVLAEFEVFQVVKK
jgi:hypothetical protein